MLHFKLHETYYLPYSVSLCPNNFSVACTDDGQYEFAIIHKYGIITGNQDGTADVLKKPWSAETTVPTGALVLSLVIFQTKIFLFQGKAVLVALSSRGPFISFGGDLEPFPGFSLEELAPNAEWSMHTCLAILGENMICIGNCLSQIAVFRLDSYGKEGLVNVQSIHASSRSKVQQMTADKSLLVAADSNGKIWSWHLEKDTVVPVLKGFPSGITLLLNTMTLTDTFIALGFSNGLLRLLCRDSGMVYCDASTHAGSLTAMTYNCKSQILLTVGEDSYIRIWGIDEKNDEKIRYLHHEIVEDMMLCGVQFLNTDGTRFGAVGYDRSDLITFKS